MRGALTPTPTHAAPPPAQRSDAGLRARGRPGRVGLDAAGSPGRRLRAARDAARGAPALGSRPPPQLRVHGGRGQRGVHRQPPAHRPTYLPRVLAAGLSASCRRLRLHHQCASAAATPPSTSPLPLTPSEGVSRPVRHPRLAATRAGVLCPKRALRTRVRRLLAPVPAGRRGVHDGGGWPGAWGRVRQLAPRQTPTPRSARRCSSTCGTYAG